MKQTLYAVSFKLLKNPPASDTDDADSTVAHSGFLTWLKHLALYFSAVMVAAMIGLFFLWKIPVLQDTAQLFKNASDATAPKTMTSVAAPPIPSGSTSNGAPRSSEDAEPTTEGPSSSVETAASDDPNTAPSSAESPTTAAADQAEPTDPPSETALPTPQAEIEQLLSDAQQQMNSRRFTAPASGNALNTYRRVLELQPDHPAALEGIQRIAAYYRDVAQTSLQQGRLDESLAYINRGLRASPKNDALLSLRRNAQRAKQREQEERQALLEDLQRQQEEQARIGRFRQEREQPSPQPWWRQPAQSHESGFNQR